jgi:hypothetical protein
LNGYLGEEMMQLFIDAGPIPQNVQFNEEWSDVMYAHFDNRLVEKGLTQEQIDELKKEAKVGNR